MPGVWAPLFVCLFVCVHWLVYSFGLLAAWDGLDCFLTPPTFYPWVSLPLPHPSLLSSHALRESSAVPMMKEEGLLSRRRFSTCGGTASLRPPHPDGRKLIRNASFGGYNELSPISLPGGCMIGWRQCFVDLHTGMCCWPFSQPCSFTSWLTIISVVVDVAS